MTTATVGAMVGGAAISTALTAPIAAVVGWQGALAIWGVTALVAVAVYRLAAPRSPALAPEPPRSGTTIGVWRRPGVWALAAYFALQSGSFYGATAWLPTLLPEVTGMSAHAAATAASAFQLTGVVGAISVPVLVVRPYSRRLIAVAVSASWAALGAGLLLAPDLAIVWLVIAGFGQGGCFALVMTMITVRAPDATSVRPLSGMVQTVGYSVSALVPVVLGWLLETSGPSAPLLMLAGMALGLVLLGATIGSRRPL